MEARFGDLAKFRTRGSKVRRSHYISFQMGGSAAIYAIFALLTCVATGAPLGASPLNYRISQ